MNIQDSMGSDPNNLLRQRESIHFEFCEEVCFFGGKSATHPSNALEFLFCELFSDLSD